MNDIGIDGARSLRLEAVRLAMLGSFWNHRLLNGNYWRLYRNFSRGAGVVVDNRRQPLDPENIYLLPPNCNLRTYCGGAGFRQLYLHFELPWCNCSRPICTIAADSLLDEIQTGLVDALDTSSERVLSFAFALVGAVLVRLPEGLLTARPYDYPISRVCEYMRNNLDSRLGVVEFTRMSQLPAGEFNRRFREAVGCTPYHYLTDLRYRRAEELLAASELSIDEICEAVGFLDRFHFSRNFKLRYGTSPAAYRRKMRMVPPTVNLMANS